jgi:hypothetical protein
MRAWCRNFNDTGLQTRIGTDFEIRDSLGLEISLHTDELVFVK